MSELQPYISRIAQKLQLLLKKQEHLRKENEKLRSDLAAKEKAITEMESKLVALEEKVAILKTAAGNMDEKSKKEFEKKIGLYIRDIDKVIAHLNG